MAYITKKQDKKGANTMKKKYVVSLLSALTGKKYSH